MFNHPLRNHRSYTAAIAHRLSGVALALFLPVHFLLLGSALGGVEGLDGALALTELPGVKVAEWGLVFLLAMHLFFGTRLLVLEFTGWPGERDQLGAWVLPGLVASVIVGVVFLIQLSA